MRPITEKKSYNMTDKDANRGARKNCIHVVSKGSESSAAFLDDQSLLRLDKANIAEIALEDNPSLDDSLTEINNILKAINEDLADHNEDILTAIKKARFSEQDERLAGIIIKQTLQVSNSASPKSPFCFTMQHLYQDEQGLWQFRYVVMSISCILLRGGQNLYRKMGEASSNEPEGESSAGELINAFNRELNGTENSLIKDFFIEQKLTAQKIVDFVDHMANNTLTQKERLLRDKLYRKITDQTGFEPVHVMIQEASSKQDEVIIHEKEVPQPWYRLLINAIQRLYLRIATWLTQTFGKKNKVVSLNGSAAAPPPDAPAPAPAPAPADPATQGRNPDPLEDPTNAHGQKPSNA